MALFVQSALFPSLHSLANSVAGTNYNQLAKLIYPSPQYHSFTIPKKTGGQRIINAPAKKIKNIQWEVLKLIQSSYPSVKPPVHGFAKKRSIVTNAEQHLGKNFIFNIDLKDFFPSIHFGRVRGVFLQKPFEFPIEIATVLAHICCKNGKLPQGAPTSPIISNLICRLLDRELQSLAKKHRATYTRYCDDITFSFSNKTPNSLPSQIVDLSSTDVQAGVELQAIIKKHSFSINPSKVRLHSRSSRMEVTGLTVNEQPNVPRKVIHEIRGMIHAWDRYGITNAQNYLAQKYQRQLRTPAIPPFQNVLRGKLLFLKMVRGESSPVYAKLAARFNNLVERDGLDVKLVLPISRKVANNIDAERATFAVECIQDFKELKEPLVSSGTCFIYREKYIVTCWHVISPRLEGFDKPFTFDDASIELHDYNKKKLKVKILAKCEGRDIALLEPEFDISAYPYFSPADKSPSSGDLLQILGFPNYRTSKKVSRTNTELMTEQYPKHGVQYIEVKDTIRKGNSGGPVIDGNKKIVGLAVEGATQADGDNGVVVTSEIDSVIAKLTDL